MKNIFKKATLTSIVFATSSLFTSAVVLAQSYDYEYDWETSNDAAEGFLGLGFGLMWCCIGLCFMIFPILLAIYVYKDSEKSKIDNSIIWALLTFILWVGPIPLGLLIYFFVIKPDNLKKQAVTPGEKKSEAKVEPKKEEVKEDKKEEMK
jgi:uncharacterized membrane protein YhaH (DUF805 family)